MASQKHEATFVGLDIGTSNIICAVGLHQQDQATPSIIGIGRSKVTGLKRGVVTDVEETVSAITAALEEAERMSGVAIDKATVSIDGPHLQSLNTNGVVAVARADHEIVKEDITRVESIASGVTLDANRQIIAVIPKAYHVDEQKNVAQPIGMNGIRLEVDTHIITGSVPAVKNLHNSVFRSGIIINSQVVTAHAAAKALTTKSQRDLGCIVLHFGAETTGIVVFSDGMPNYTSVIPLGSHHITKDLVYGLRTTEDVAEKLKVEHAQAQKPKNKSNVKIDLQQYGAAGNVYQHDIDSIVSSRLEEIFTLVAGEIEKAQKLTTGLGGGITLTGGGANMPQIADYASQVLGHPVKVGSPTGYSGISEKISDPSFSAVIGLMLEDMEVPHVSAQPKPLVFVKNIFSKIKAIIKGLLP